MYLLDALFWWILEIFLKWIWPSCWEKPALTSMSKGLNVLVVVLKTASCFLCTFCSVLSPLATREARLERSYLQTLLRGLAASLLMHMALWEHGSCCSLLASSPAHVD